MYRMYMHTTFAFLWSRNVNMASARSWSNDFDKLLRGKLEGRKPIYRHRDLCGSWCVPQEIAMFISWFAETSVPRWHVGERRKALKTRITVSVNILPLWNPIWRTQCYKLCAQGTCFIFQNGTDLTMSSRAEKKRTRVAAIIKSFSGSGFFVWTFYFLCMPFRHSQVCL